MDFLLGFIEEFLKIVLINGIVDNLGGLFDEVNNRVGVIASTVGTPPAAWQPGVFSLIRNISETVVLPIAGIIITFLATYELLNLIVDKNNLNDVDTWMFFKLVFKTFIAILILSNTFNIVMAVFDVAQSVINSAGGLIAGSTQVTVDILAEFEASLWERELGSLLGLWLHTIFIELTVRALSLVIFVIVYGRMVEIFLLTSLAPIPLATLSNREFGGMGQNYFKSLCAIALQGLLILVCVGIYAVLVQNIATSGNPITAIWTVVGHTILLAFTLFKTGSVAKSVLGC